MKSRYSADSLKQKARARQGNTYNVALELLENTANNFAQEVAGDYRLTLVCEDAEGAYVLEEITPGNPGLVWRSPLLKENQHIEIAVQDKEDLRFIPYLDVFCRLYNAENKLLGEKLQPFIWHPYLDHYGENWTLHGEGDYFVEVTVKKAKFPRHDETLGDRYKADVQIRFGPLHLIPGRRESNQK